MLLRPCTGELVLPLLLCAGSLLILSFRPLRLYSLLKVKLNGALPSSWQCASLADTVWFWEWGCMLECVWKTEDWGFEKGLSDCPALALPCAVRGWRERRLCWLWEISAFFRPAAHPTAPTATGGGGLDGGLQGDDVLSKTWKLEWRTLLSAWFSWRPAQGRDPKSWWPERGRGDLDGREGDVALLPCCCPRGGLGGVCKS